MGTTHTTEYIRTDVGRAPPLVLQQVPLTHKMFPKAEVGDSYPMGPKNGRRQRVNTESPRPRHPAGSGPYSKQKQPATRFLFVSTAPSSLEPAPLAESQGYSSELGQFPEVFANL